jgi:hypothetical protein
VFLAIHPNWLRGPHWLSSIEPCFVPTLECQPYLAVYFLLYLMGEVPLVSAIMGFVCTILGTCVGTFAYAAAMEQFPMAGYKGINAVKAAGGMYHGAAAEAAVAFVNFLFAGRGLHRSLDKPQLSCFISCYH